MIASVDTSATIGASSSDVAKRPPPPPPPPPPHKIGTAIDADAVVVDLSGAEETEAEEDKTSASGLTPEEEDIVKGMAARDAEVRRHEQAHAAVGGQYAGSPSYTYESGPDGRQYAVAGEVPIDVSPVQDDPEATVDKMEVVKAAALAPAEPSGPDRQVAALADSIRAQATADLMQLRTAEARGETDGAVPQDGSSLTDLLNAVAPEAASEPEFFARA